MTTLPVAGNGSINERALAGPRPATTVRQGEMNTVLREREREREREKVGGSERHYIWGGGKKLYHRF
jgi:hypothetical protein